MGARIEYGEPFNGRKPKIVFIGTVELTETKTFRRHYETAAWYKDIQCEPQKSEIKLVDDYWLIYGWNGIVVDDYFPSLFGGVAVGKPYQPKDIGKPDTYTVQTQPYLLKNIETFIPYDNIDILPEYPHVSYDRVS
jgi:hypothetical protein